MRIPFDTLYHELVRLHLQVGFSPDRAALSARLFTEATRDGVASHGLNRIPRFVEMIRRGTIDVDAIPIQAGGFGAVEQWDGRGGPGNLNAHACMARALTLSEKYGLGCVALRNTNHWMRGGSYGWQAAEAGALGMCWTNTMPNLPAWGAREASVGNNPIIIAVPRPDGHVVLDMAMSQFSYGTLESYRRQGKVLPADGGFDSEGNLTRDPAAIEATGRALPIGLWKGSGLAMVLDLMASLLSGGRATHQISTDIHAETGLSQVFLAFNLHRLHSSDEAARIADDIVAFVHAAAPITQGESVYYPGERTRSVREENETLGIPVDPEVWAQVQAL